MFTLFIFFFSSRRRHTRWPRDWSSDVCSSDLPGVVGGVVRGHLLVHGPDPLGQPVQFPFRSGHFLTCCPLLGGGDLGGCRVASGASFGRAGVGSAPRAGGGRGGRRGAGTATGTGGAASQAPVFLHPAGKVALP